MKTFIHIRSTRFPILPGEEEELLNEGTYGKALAEYLQAELAKRGYDAPFVCCEDWGWWVELKAPFTFGVCIYVSLVVPSFRPLGAAAERPARRRRPTARSPRWASRTGARRAPPPRG